jgi:hypothetical protein
MLVAFNYLMEPSAEKAGGGDELLSVGRAHIKKLH